MPHPTTVVTVVFTVIVYAFTVATTVLFGSLVIFWSVFRKRSDEVHWLARMWARSILAVSMVRVRVCGAENVDPGTACIFMANHQSNFDIPAVLGCLPFQFRWLAKAELFRIPVFGKGMRGAGYISIDRRNRDSAFRSLKQASEIIRGGASVLIFPEGTRSQDGCIGPFKKGGFVLAVDAGVPIVPIIISGTRRIMPKNELLVRPGEVFLDILRPIQTAAYTRKTKNALLERVRQELTAGLQRRKESSPSC